MAFDPDAYLKKKQGEPAQGFDPDAYLKKKSSEEPSRLQSFGRASASLADTALNTITGALDLAAYPVARAYYGMTMDDQAAAAAQAQRETTSPKDVFGRTFGVTGTADYEQAPLRAAGRYVGEAIGENVVQPIAQATGMPESDVSNMVGWGTMAVAPGVSRGVSATGRGVAATGRAIGDVTGGAYSTLTGKTALPGQTPKPWQQPSARAPVGETYITPESLAAWRRGEIPTTGVQRVPTSQLPQDLLAKTEGTVPYAGQGWRALGEQIGETYRNPLNVLTDVGLDVLTGGVGPTTLRLGYKGYKAAQNVRAAKGLERAGFTPISPEEMAALQSGRNIYGYGQTPANTTPGTPGFDFRAASAAAQQTPQLGYQPQPTPTTIAQPGPGRRVNIEGETYNLPYEIDLSQVSGARAPQQPAIPATGPVSPTQLINPQEVAATARQAVAETQQPVSGVQQGLASTPRGADILEQIRSRGAGWRPTRQTEGYRPPMTETPVAPRAWAPIPETAKGGLDLTAMRAQLQERVSPVTQELQSQAVEARNQQLAERRAANRPTVELKRSIKQTAQGGITQKNKNIIVNETVFNDLAPEGVTIDWTQMPATAGMSLKQARQTIRKFVEDQLIRQPAGRAARTEPGTNMGSLFDDVSNMSAADRFKAGMDTPEGTAAALGREGSWEHNGTTFKAEKVGGGEFRVQARRDGQVIWEQYY